MALQQAIDIRARSGQLSLDEPDGLHAEAFVVIETDDPVMRALRHREGAGLFYCRRPRDGDDQVGMRRGDRRSAIGGRFVDDDNFVGETQGAHTGSDQRRTVVGDNDST